MEDVYTYYVLVLGLGEDFFWNQPIQAVERAAKNKAAFNAWMANPK